MKKILKGIINFIITEVVFAIVSLVFGTIAYFVFYFNSEKLMEFTLEDYIFKMFIVFISFNVFFIALNIIYEIGKFIHNKIKKKENKKIDDFKPVFPDYPIAINIYLSNEKTYIFNKDSMVAIYNDVKRRNTMFMKHEQYIVDNYSNIMYGDEKELSKFEHVLREDVEKYNLYTESKIEKKVRDLTKNSFDAIISDLMSLYIKFIVVIALLVLCRYYFYFGLLVSSYVLYKYYSVIDKSFSDEGKAIRDQMNKNYKYFKKKLGTLDNLKDNDETKAIYENKNYELYLMIYGYKKPEKWDVE